MFHHSTVSTQRLLKLPLPEPGVTTVYYFSYFSGKGVVLRDGSGRLFYTDAEFLYNMMLHYRAHRDMPVVIGNDSPLEPESDDGLDDDGMFSYIVNDD